MVDLKVPTPSGSGTDRSFPESDRPKIKDKLVYDRSEHPFGTKPDVRSQIPLSKTNQRSHRTPFNGGKRPSGRTSPSTLVN